MTSPHPVACTCIISQRTTKWAEHEAGRLFILYLLSSLSRFLPLSASAVHDDKMKARRSRDRDRECVFMAPSSEIPPFSIIYRLVSLGLGADSFIRWGVGGSCFDLKIRTIIASGVGKVKESPCVLIRKKSLIFFFFFLSVSAEMQKIWKYWSRWHWGCINSLPSKRFLWEYGIMCTGGLVNKNQARGLDFELLCFLAHISVRSVFVMCFEGPDSTSSNIPPLHPSLNVFQSIGKGSLWSIDPEYRHNLIQALKKTPYHPYSPGLATPSTSPPTLPQTFHHR